MKLLRLSIVLCFLLMVFLRSNAQADSAKASIKISREVAKPLTLYATQLADMNRTTVSIRGRDGKDHEYTGVPLQLLLELAGVTMGKELRRENLSKYLLVKCADGYEVVFSLAEIDSSFTDRIIVLADAYEGQPIKPERGPFQLAVPGKKNRREIASR